MKTVVSDLSEIPEALHGEYEERDGQFHLKIEGSVPGHVSLKEHREAKEKIARFRDKYTSVMKRASELVGVEELDDDLTPVRETLSGLKRKLEEATATPTDKALQEQIQAAIKPLQEKLDKTEAERQAALERANRGLLHGELGDALGKAGVRANAKAFLLAQGEQIFDVANDKVVTREGHFSEGGEVLSVGDWVKQMVKEHDYAFEHSSGGGARGGANGAPTISGQKILRNPTPEDLGRHMKEIADGKMQVIND